MSVFDFASGGGATPPAWLALAGGIAFIIYFAYRVHKGWRGLTGGDLFAAIIGFLMGGMLVLEGLSLLRH